MRLLRLNTALIFPLLALLIVLAPDLVPWVFGSDWTDAVAPTQVLAVAGMWSILVGRHRRAAVRGRATRRTRDLPHRHGGRPGRDRVVHGADRHHRRRCGRTDMLAGAAARRSVVPAPPLGRHSDARKRWGGRGPARAQPSSWSRCCRLQTFCAARSRPLPLSLLIGSLGIALYAFCLRIVSPPAWGDVRTLFVRVLGARRLLPG